MEPRFRHGELLSEDAKLRLAIYDRADHRYMIVEERVRSYKAGDEWNPEVVAFPCDSRWEPHWQIFAQPRSGIFGTVEDALSEGKRLLANGG
jgi:hypothetical protein